METTAYNDYLRTDVLHSLQHEVTTLDGERSFIVVCQVQELYYGLIAHELRTAIAHLRADHLEPAIACLRRAATHFTALNASWASLQWMLPADFQTIKQGMTAVHGRSSSLQSWTYRGMLHLMGLRDDALLEPINAMPSQRAQLDESLASPSVYDEVLDALRRVGLEVPARTSPESQVDLALATFWGELRTPGRQVPSRTVLDFAPALLSVAEGLAGYRHLHYLATLRTLGSRPAYYGVSGVEWLEPTLTQMAFPDLWATTVPGEGAPA